MSTHAVLNQPPPLGDVDLFASDPILAPGVREFDALWAEDRLSAFGRLSGSAETQDLAEAANRYEPQLRTHDRYGHRIDQVDFHPAWHELMDRAVTHRVHSLGWSEDRSGSQVARTSLMYLDSQVEQGHGCPISMTASVVPSLRMAPELSARWEPRLLSTEYDPSFQPVNRKRGALMGMGMTEKQGGSDVRTNTTIAEPVSNGFLLTGHKWFTSAPMCDAFLVLAQAPSGLSCFFVPRFLDDGTPNTFRIQRLKEKLGNRSNASSEIEFADTHGWMVGEEGRGVPTIIEMVNGTRLDCITGSAALMRQSLTHAAWHVSHRTAFGRTLIDQPAMTNVIADLELEAEAATLMMLRVAAMFDRAADDEREASLRRVATPIAKYWVTKRTTAVVREAMECLGGNGYVEESPLPRWFRESPLNAIWEGSGNVIALDLLRAIHREPEALTYFADEALLGASTAAAGHLDTAREMIRTSDHPESDARRIVERLALAWASSLMARHTSHGDLYDAGRLLEPHGLFGTLPHTDDLRSIAEAAVPTPL
ncbi:MAG: acyl-CoA dehydrogenase family protein [Acidimicrobiia bacterium]|nr:acyl-CoA dehydrogenase family protein [Acidimicrobiia bacterium]